MTCRLFLRKLRMELKIPVLALVDSDPYGLKILAVYMKGVVHLVPTLRLHPWPWFLST
jgi:DNA topoisomerase VI subunit A